MPVHPTGSACAQHVEIFWRHGARLQHALDSIAVAVHAHVDKFYPLADPAIEANLLISAFSQRNAMRSDLVCHSPTLSEAALAVAVQRAMTHWTAA